MLNVLNRYPSGFARFLNFLQPEQEKEKLLQTEEYQSKLIYLLKLL